VGGVKAIPLHILFLSLVHHVVWECLLRSSLTSSFPLGSPLAPRTGPSSLASLRPGCHWQ